MKVPARAAILAGLALLLVAAQDIRIAPPSGDGSLVPPAPRVIEVTVDANWQRQVVAQIVRGQRYPPAALREEAQGTAHVRFRVSAKGRVLSVQIAHSSGNALLDAEALQSILRAQPLPRMPRGSPAPIDLVLPVTFRIAE